MKVRIPHKSLIQVMRMRAKMWAVLVMKRLQKLRKVVHQIYLKNGRKSSGDALLLVRDPTKLLIWTLDHYCRLWLVASCVEFALCRNESHNEVVLNLSDFCFPRHGLFSTTQLDHPRAVKPSRKLIECNLPVQQSPMIVTSLLGKWIARCADPIRHIPNVVVTARDEASSLPLILSVSRLCCMSWKGPKCFSKNHCCFDLTRDFGFPLKKISQVLLSWMIWDLTRFIVTNDSTWRAFFGQMTRLDLYSDFWKF